MITQKLRKRLYLIISKFLSQKNYWNIVGNFSTLDSILDGCTDLNSFFNSGKYTTDNFFVKEKLINKNSLTLHIGCGIGRIEKHLCRKVNKCYGIDIAKSMIKKAKTHVKAKNTEFILTDGKTLLFQITILILFIHFEFFNICLPLFLKKILKKLTGLLRKQVGFYFKFL